MYFPPWWLKVAVKVVFGSVLIIALLTLILSVTVGPIVLGMYYTWHGDYAFGAFLVGGGAAISSCFIVPNL